MPNLLAMACAFQKESLSRKRFGKKQEKVGGKSYICKNQKDIAIMMNELIETLRTEQYALVILHEGNISTFEGRGVRTLYNILEERPELLLGAKAAIKAAGQTAAKAMLEGGVREVNGHAYCSWFNFSGADQNKKVGVLSGGEKNRLNLGMMLKESGNVLMLDEPTNDLDVQTVRALEEALEDFAGCALVVSHDRWFLDRICTHILAFENNSQVRWFEGNWSEYAEWKKQQFGEDAGVPKRTVYRKMTR